jgi:hypothetical protein
LGLYRKNVKLRYPIIGAVALVTIAFLLRPIIELKTNTFPWYFIFVSLLGILSLYYFVTHYCRSFNKPKLWLIACGTDSLILLGLHNQIFYLSDLVYKHLPIPVRLFGCPTIYIYGIILVLIATFISLKLGKMLHRHAPVLIGK